MPRELTLVRRDDIHVLRADDDVHRLVFAEATVQAAEFLPAEADPVVFQHDAVDDVALADKICHKGVDRLVVNVRRCADLLDLAVDS